MKDCQNCYGVNLITRSLNWVIARNQSIYFIQSGAAEDSGSDRFSYYEYHVGTTKNNVIFPPAASTPTQAVSLARDIQYFSGVKRPVWFVYSGMGSQWAGMASELMRVPIFAAAIQK